MSLTKKVGRVLAVIFIAAVCELFTTVILGRNLPAELFGKFKFIHTIVLMLCSVLVLGQNVTIIRLLVKDNKSKYDWKQFIRICLFISSLFGIVVVLGIGYFYGLNKEILVICFSLICAMAIEFLSSVLRARSSYNIAIITTKSFSILFFVVVLAIFYLSDTRSLVLILSCYAACYGISAAFCVYLTKDINCGNQTFNKKAIGQGLLLFLITVSFTVMVQIDQFFIAKMLDYEQLGGYTAAITVTRGFDLLAMALWFVLMPQYTKEQSRPIGSDIIKAAIAGGSLVLIYIFCSGVLLDVFFKAKFNNSAFLLKYFIAIGFLRVLYAIPAGIVGGKLSSRILRVYLICCLIGIIINILGNLYLIPIWGLSGAAAATLAAWVFRVFAAYIIIIMFDKNNSQEVVLN